MLYTHKGDIPCASITEIFIVICPFRAEFQVTKRETFNPVTPQKILNHVVAVIGCDGSGKSTLTADLIDHLHDKETVAFIYLGQSSGNIADWMLPTIKQISTASEDIFMMLDLHNFGVDYDHTLMAWMANVDNCKTTLQEAGYDEKFYRMWRFFLLGAAGGFRSHRNHLWKIVYSKHAIDGGYQSVR